MARIILASTSPRRIGLLADAGLKVKVLAPDSDEKRLPGEPARRFVARVAREKAASVARRPDAIIIAADTIVVSPEKQEILGKPKSIADARRMLRLLSGKTHTVLTGYCVFGVNTDGIPREVSRVVSSQVKMRVLDDATIRRYVASGEPMDKAGSYAAQGLGMALIEKISGSYTNVVGLPIAQLLKDLETHFGIPLYGN